jgi:hypothetical protein
MARFKQTARKNTSGLLPRPSMSYAIGPTVAVNFRGWVMEDRRENGGKYEEITAHAPIQTTLAEAVKPAEIDRRKRQSVQIFRAGLGLTAEEQQRPKDDTTMRYCIVGYTFPNLDHNIKRSRPPYATEMTKSYEFVPQDQIIPLRSLGDDPERPPLYVVHPIGTESLSHQLYCLLCPLDGLCKAYSVSQENVFFRAEFRDDSVIKPYHRRLIWLGLISEHCTRPEGGSAVNGYPPAKKARIGSYNASNSNSESPSDAGADKPSDLHLPRKRQASVSSHSSANVTDNAIKPDEEGVVDLSGVVPRLQRCGRFRSRLVGVIEEVKYDLYDIAPPELQGIPAFFTANFGRDDAAALVREAYSMWGEVNSLTTERVLLLHECLEVSKLEFQNSELHGLLVEGSYQIQRHGDNLDKVAGGPTGLARDILDTIRRLKPATPTARSIISEEDQKLYTANQQIIEEKLSGLLEHYDELAGELF